MAAKPTSYKFVSKPDANLICSICLELASSPKQCEDCGKLFCSECIEKNGRKPCPNCRTKNPKYFKDVKSGREIKELSVRCVSVERGCEWTGTIGTFNSHMSTCQFALVSCPNKCEEDEQLTIIRKDLDNHLKTACPNRAHQCQHCGEKGTYASITEDHDKVCNKKIVSCPNKERGCPLSMERGKTKQHVRSVCDYTEVVCTYENLGCRVRMMRKDTEKHVKQDREQHVTFSLDTVTILSDQLNVLIEQNQTLSDSEAFVFKLPEFLIKKENSTKFFSSHFYTHRDGYRMRIRVDANGDGDGAGTHVSVFTEPIKGRYDDQLHWPFIGTVKCELLNQLTDDRHYSDITTFDASEDMQIGSCMGCSKFFPHSSLSHDPATNTQYLLDDTLYFRVSVTVANHKPWLVCTDKINMDTISAIKNSKTLKDGEPLVIKMTGYKDRKANDEWYFSDPFYTSPNGYKMSIHIEPNGVGLGHGTHVSVSASMLEGAYDASLSWPFTGTVTFTLLNQLADKNHHTWSRRYTVDSDYYAGSDTGKELFISHSSLSHNPVKNTQFLKDDTLYFKVIVKDNHYKPWLKCTLR